MSSRVIRRAWRWGSWPRRLLGRCPRAPLGQWPRAPLAPWLRLRLRQGAESGQVTLLVLGFTVIAMLMVVGTTAVTSAQLSRIRLLDVADGAALDAADSLDTAAYDVGLDGSVAISDDTVRAAAERYLSERRLPRGMQAWAVAPGTGSPDGRTAVVRLVGRVELPLVGSLLGALGGSVTITVESRARADLG